MAHKKTILNYSQKLFPSKVKDRIFFLHLPKCGGTSIIDAIASHYGLAEVVSRRHFFAVSPEASEKAARLLGQDMWTYRENLLLYYMSDPKMKYVSGHFLYSERAMQEYKECWSFVTILRDPVSRWFSHYFMDRYKDTVPEFAKIGLDLEAFIETEEAKFFGAFYAVAFNGNVSVAEATTQSGINRAIANLEKFSLVGTLENIDRFAEDYRGIFGAELLIPRRNTSVVAQEKQHSLVTPEIRAKVEELCQASTEIYQYVLGKDSCFAQSAP